MQVVWVKDTIITDLLTPELIGKLNDYRNEYGTDDGTIWIDEEVIQELLQQKQITEGEAKILREMLKKTDKKGIRIWIGYT